MPQSVVSTKGFQRLPVLQSVERMQRVIDLARTIRERHGKTLKLPLRSLIVVHDDDSFLRDLEGTTLTAPLGTKIPTGQSGSHHVVPKLYNLKF